MRDDVGTCESRSNAMIRYLSFNNIIKFICLFYSARKNASASFVKHSKRTPCFRQFSPSLPLCSSSPLSSIQQRQLSSEYYGNSTHSYFCYTHDDIMWQLGPSIDAPVWSKLLWKTKADPVRSFQNFNNERILIPKAFATLQAFLRNSKTRNPIAKFGITTESGPFCEELEETIQDIYQDNCGGGAIGVAAIKYMFVEPEYRRQGLGSLALEVISQIHAWQKCSYTVLIADDDGSGKLIEWYKSHGFSLAPKLDRVFGCVQNSSSCVDNGTASSVLGIAMISPTSSKLSNGSIHSSVYIHCE
jgi:GNAT superfamily N-acetyltransferase